MEFTLSWLSMFIGFFIVQIVLCLKVKNTILKFIPAMIIGLSYILAIMLYIGGSAGLFPSGGKAAGAFIMLFSSADLLGCLAGWIGYVVINKIKAKKSGK